MGASVNRSQERAVSGKWSSLEGWVDLDIGRRRERHEHVLKLGIQMASYSANNGRSRLRVEREANVSKKGDEGLSP